MPPISYTASLYQHYAVAAADRAMLKHVDIPVSSMERQMQTRTLATVQQPSTEISIAPGNDMRQSLQRWKPIAKRSGVVMGAAMGGTIAAGATVGATTIAAAGALVLAGEIAAGAVVFTGLAATPIVGAVGIAVGLGIAAGGVYKDELSVFTHNLNTKMICDGFFTYMTDPTILSEKSPSRRRSARAKQEEACLTVLKIEYGPKVLDQLSNTVQYETDMDIVESAVRSLSLMGKGGLAVLTRLQVHYLLETDHEARLGFILKGLVLMNSEESWIQLERLIDEDEVQLAEQIDMQLFSFTDEALDARQAAWVLNHGGTLKWANLKFEKEEDLTNKLNDRGQTRLNEGHGYLESSMVRCKHSSVLKTIRTKYDIPQLKKNLMCTDIEVRLEATRIVNTHLLEHMDELRLTETLLSSYKKFFSVSINSLILEKDFKHLEKTHAKLILEALMQSKDQKTYRFMVDMRMNFDQHYLKVDEEGQVKFGIRRKTKVFHPHMEIEFADFFLKNNRRAIFFIHLHQMNRIKEESTRYYRIAYTFDQLNRFEKHDLAPYQDEFEHWLVLINGLDPDNFNNKSIDYLEEILRKIRTV